MDKPVIGIHEGVNRSFPDSFLRYEKILEHNSVSHIRLNCNNADFWKKIKEINCFIFSFFHLDSEFQVARSILPILEREYGIQCFPNQTSCWHYDDKIKQYYLLQAHDFPMAGTWVFWDIASTLEWLESADFPVVFKLKGGAGSANVVLVQNKAEAVKLTKKMFADKGVSFGRIPHRNNLTYLRDILKLYGVRRWLADKRGRLGRGGKNPYWQIHRDYVLFQRFLPNNKYDIRITVIGEKAFAFRRFTRSNDFRASGSGLIDYNRDKIDPRCLEIAFNISKTLNFQCMAYDFLFDEDNNPKIAEISYTFVDTAVHDCPGYFDNKLNWHEGHFWPQFCVLQNLFPDIKLKQPPANIMLG